MSLKTIFRFKKKLRRKKMGAKKGDTIYRLQRSQAFQVAGVLRELDISKYDSHELTGIVAERVGFKLTPHIVQSVCKDAGIPWVVTNKRASPGTSAKARIDALEAKLEKLTASHEELEALVFESLYTG
jgi:hypothetical protein